jgi:hypothetical protein
MVNETETPDDDIDRRGDPHIPTAESRARVESLSSYGVPQKSIAALIGLGSKMTLRKHYTAELQIGDAKFQAMLGQTAARVALGGPAEYYPKSHLTMAGQLAKAEVLPNVAMLIFFLKTRLGLQERVSLDLEDRRPDDGNEFNTVGLTQAERTSRIVALLKTAESKKKKAVTIPPKPAIENRKLN